MEQKTEQKSVENAGLPNTEKENRPDEFRQGGSAFMGLRGSV